MEKSGSVLTFHWRNETFLRQRENVRNVWFQFKIKSFTEFQLRGGFVQLTIEYKILVNYFSKVSAILGYLVFQIFWILGHPKFFHWKFQVVKNFLINEPKKFYWGKWICWMHKSATVMNCLLTKCHLFIWHKTKRLMCGIVKASKAALVMVE